jgi:hypothetical protein
MFRNHIGTWLNALNNEGCHHERHHSVLGNADAHQRNEAGASGGFVGGCRPGYALDRSIADLLPIFADFFLDGVGDELSNRRTTSGQYAV